jgi:muconate cycloisomerase
MAQPEIRITEVRLTPVAVRRTTGLLCSHVVVEVLTDEDGLYGIGEMSDLGHLPAYFPDVADLTRTLNAMFVGQDPLAIEAHEHSLRKAFPEQSFVYDMGAVIRCGVDVALHDLRAKAFGLSVTQMLGGITRDRFKVAFPVFRHRKRDEVPANMERVRRMFEQGFDVIRLYVGVDSKADELFLKTLRDEFQERIRVKSPDRDRGEPGPGERLRGPARVPAPLASPRVGALLLVPPGREPDPRAMRGRSERVHDVHRRDRAGEEALRDG